MIRKLVIPAVLVLAACASSKTGPSVEAVRQELEGVYQNLAEANARRDMDAVAAMWSDDFSMMDADGRQVGTSEVRERWQERLDISLDPLHFRYSIQELEIHGDEVTATVLQEISSMNAIGGELKRVDTTTTQRETWVRVGPDWKLRRISNVREGRRLVNGVPSNQL